MINYTVSWGKKKICVGGQAPILINQLVGCNGTSGVRECIEKLKCGNWIMRAPILLQM